MKYVHFRVNEVRVENKIVKTIGTLDLGEGVTFPACSGGWGNGTLPHGVYDITIVKKVPDNEQNKVYKGKRFNWYAYLQPLFKTSRNGLLIHPDNYPPGTLGCIGVTERDDELYDKLILLTTASPVKLIVL